MGGNKTQDGIKLTSILRAAVQAGIGYRTGTNHPYLLTHEGLRPCPVANSTHAKRMVVPWMVEATGRDREETYDCLRNGSW